MQWVIILRVFLFFGLFDIACVVSGIACADSVEETIKNSAMIKDVLIPSPSPVGVKSYILQDADSLDVLAEKNPDEVIHPASLTKMMTAYIVEAQLHRGSIKRDDIVTISENAWSLGGSTMFLEPKQEVTVENLLRGVIIASGNDASVALAEHLAGSEDAFSQIMNSVARELGMMNTYFVNASGWPAKGHFSTARDLAVLSRHIIYDYPENYGVYGEKYFSYGVDRKTGKPLRQTNRNNLLWRNQNVDGIKTGHTEDSGYHLAATAEQDGRRLIVVVLKASNEKQRADDAQMLLTYGFRYFENVKINEGNNSILTARVWEGDLPEIDVGIEEKLVVTVPRGTSKKITTEYNLQTTITAPVRKGQVVGILVVKRGKDVLKKVSLVSRHHVEVGSIIKMMWDRIRVFVSKFFNTS